MLTDLVLTLLMKSLQLLRVVQMVNKMAWPCAPTAGIHSKAHKNEKKNNNNTFSTVQQICVSSFLLVLFNSHLIYINRKTALHNITFSDLQIYLQKCVNKILKHMAYLTNRLQLRRLQR